MGIAAHLVPFSCFFGQPSIGILGMPDATTCGLVVAELVALSPAFT